MTAALAWILSHKTLIVSSVAAALGALRAVPAARWRELELAWPRVAAFVRLLRGAFPDVYKVTVALVAIWTGAPRTPPALPPVLDPAQGEVLPATRPPEAP